MTIEIIALKLSAQRALLGNVSIKLRAVCVNISVKVISVNFYYDGEIFEDANELSQSTMDEIIADFCHDDQIKFEINIIRKDFPQKMPLVGHWVYYRNEP